MKKKLILVFTTFSLCTFAQVGIGTPTPRAALEVNSSTNGFLAPQIALTTTTLATPVVNPVGGALTAGTIVYNTATVSDVTPGYYYWNGTIWIRMAGGASASSTDWTILGNSGTTPGTNFIGTTDNQSLAVRTNNIERMRILNNGQVAINTTTPIAGTIFSTYTTGSDYAVNGFSTGTGYAVYGQNTGTGNAINGIATAATTTGVRGANTNASGTGIFGAGNNQAATYLVSGSGGAFTGTTGAFGFSSSSAGAGIHGRNSNINGIGVYGESTAAASGTSTGTGVLGVTNQYAGSGVEGGNYNTTGTGVVGWGNGLGGNIMNTGSGVAATGNLQAIYAKYMSTGIGQAIIAQDNYGAQWYVGYWTGSAYRKILGNGTVSTVVKDLNNQNVVMNCPETPENLLMDYGIGKLSNGKAHIDIDPILSKNILVNDKHPLKVFIQLEGDCNGVYVTNKSASGFDIIELQSGTSSVSFSYNIVATMGDQTVVSPEGKSRTAKYDSRWEKAPEYQKSIQLPKSDKISSKTQEIKSETIKTLPLQ